MNAAAPLLLYDGDCGFCAAAVQFILTRDGRGTLRFAPLQGRAAAAVRERHGWLQAVDSMAWVEPGPDGGERVFVRSAAAFRAAAYLRGPWRSLAALGAIVPRRIADFVYDAIARHRHRLVASPACYVPTAAERQRFLE